MIGQPADTFEAYGTRGRGEVLGQAGVGRCPCEGRNTCPFRQSCDLICGESTSIGKGICLLGMRWS